MPALDDSHLFPNSMKAGAARRGQSRIYSMQGMGGDLGTAPPFTGTNFDPNHTTANVTLSNNNLTATVGAGGSFSGARGAIGKSAGRFYLEYSINAVGPGNYGYGFINDATTVGTGINMPGTTGVNCGTGNIWVNGNNTGVSIGSVIAGGTVCCAIDLTAHLVWFRVAPAGNWNSSATSDPTTGIQGLNISTLGSLLYPYVGWNAAAAGQVSTANFGASAFAGAVPTGFTAGWA